MTAAKRPTASFGSTAPQDAATARLDALIAALPSAVLVEDENRRVVLTNASFCELFGVPVDPLELVGADCSQAAQTSKHLFSDPDGFVTGVDASLAARRLVRREQLKLVDGRVVERDYVPVWDNGVYLGHLWNYNDVTERVQLATQLEDRAAELERANRELEAANDVMMEFAGTAAHDLGAPLRRMSMFATLLGERESVVGDDEATALLESIRRNANQASALVKALLELAMVGSEPHVSACAAGDACDAALANLSALIEESGAQIRVHELPSVAGAFGALVGVFQHLIRNAIMYAGEDAPRIDIGAEVTPAGYLFHVADNGRGLPEEYRARVFTPLVRAPTAVGKAGHGLGLTICARVLGAWGQRIWIEDGESAGTRVMFTLAAVDDDESGGSSTAA